MTGGREVGRFAGHASIYFVANVLVALAGTISLPIWTRMFSVSDYGLLSLCAVTITLMVNCSKFGLQHAALRFLPDVKHGRMSIGMPAYYSTMVLGALVLSVATTAIVLPWVRWFFEGRDPGSTAGVWWPVALAIVLQSLLNLLIIFLRADQRPGLTATFNVLRRYGRFGVALLLLLALGTEVKNLYWGWVITGAVLLAVLLFRLLRTQPISPARFSRPFFKQAIRYGFPMIWFELANSFLQLGDRYVIEFFQGREAVGLYSVGYNTATLAQSLVQQPFRMAVIPIYLALFNKQGEEATRRFLGRAMRYYIMLGLPIVLGLSWFRRPIIELLASEKYRDAAVLVPYIIGPLVLYGASVIFAAGYYLRKKTRALMGLTLVAVALNLALNLWWVPRFGILGAAYATMASYLLLVVIVAARSRRLFRVPVDAATLFRSTLFAALSVALLAYFSPPGGIVVTVAAVALLYGALQLTFDRELRGAVSRLARGRRT